MRQKGAASIAASPVLVGAVTTLIVIVSVFLAYNANQGLPFVPTYDLSAELPNGSNLVPGNEVRIGGFRVGVVDKIQPRTQVVAGRPKAIAVLHMKLDKSAAPIPVDSKFIVRARSALGLKYLQITPGSSSRNFRTGDSVPLSNSTQPVEFDDFLNTFNGPTRQASKGALAGYGDAFAGRGEDINRAIAGLNPFFRYLTPVMRNLSDKRTALDQFFRQIGAVTAQVAPVARVQARAFGEMATTFEAIGRCASCLQDTIAKTPPTEDVAIQSFKVQRPFLVDFTDLSRRLLPAARVLPTALPAINSALSAGTRVLPQTVALNQRTGKVFQALDDLVGNPNTGLALGDLRDALGVAKPLINYAAPYQTVCNYATYFTTGLGQHLSEGVSNGTTERILLKTDNMAQDNSFGMVGSDRPADVPRNQDPKTAQVGGMPLEAFHGGPYFPAIDAAGHADCQNGQQGYLSGPLGKGRYPAHNAVPGDNPQNDQFSRQFAGGSHTIFSDNSPGLAGPTFTGVPNLKDVP